MFAVLWHFFRYKITIIIPVVYDFRTQARRFELELDNFNLSEMRKMQWQTENNHRRQNAMDRHCATDLVRISHTDLYLYMICAQNP